MKDRVTVSCAFWNQNSVPRGCALLFFHPDDYCGKTRRAIPCSKDKACPKPSLLHFRKVMDLTLWHCYCDTEQQSLPESFPAFKNLYNSIASLLEIVC